MEKYYFETGDKRTTKFWILDEDGNVVKKTDNDSEITELCRAAKENSVITAIYEGNTAIGKGYVKLGNKVSGACVVAASAFR